MDTQSGAVAFGKHVAGEFSEKNVPFMAAAIAYHAFVSLAPLLLLLFFILSQVGLSVENRLVSSAITALPGPVADVVTDLLGGSGGEASAIGLLILLWGTLKIFRGLDTAFAQIYETGDGGSIVGKLRDGVVVFAALSVALVAVVGSSVVLGALTERFPFSGWLTPALLLGGLVVAFFPIYYAFPDVSVGYRDVVPGVVVAAVGWGALQGLFQLYLSVLDPSTGNFFGGVVVVVIYLYFSTLVLLLGAVINATVVGDSLRSPDGVGQPAPGFETERTASLDRAQLGTYLGELRAELIGDGGARSRSELVGDRPAPEGAVELVEQSTTAGDDNEWRVTLRWRFTDDALVESFADRAGSGDQQADAPLTDESRGGD